jgi:hypothetical protein
MLSTSPTHHSYSRRKILSSVEYFEPKLLFHKRSLKILLKYPIHEPLSWLPTLTGAARDIILPQGRLNWNSMATTSDKRVMGNRRTVLVVLLWLVKESVPDAMRVKWVTSSVGDVDGQIPALERVTPFEHTWTGLNYHPYLRVRQMKPSSLRQGARFPSQSAHRNPVREPEARAGNSTGVANTL